MRIIYMCLLMGLLSTGSWANPVSERLYVQTDKIFYLAGERMFVKVYDVDESFKLQELSCICYLEIVNSTGAELQAKIKLERGSGYSSFEIPFSTPSGMYELVAYTRWMRNEGDDVFFRKPIAIFNSLRDETDGRLKLVGDNPVQRVEQHSNCNLLVSTDKTAYSCRQPVKIKLGNISEGTDLAVSVVRQDVDLPPYTATDFQKVMKKENFSGYQWIPELNGMIVEGEAERTAVHPNISVQGKSIQFFAGQSNGGGRYSFYIPYQYGMKKLATGVERESSGSHIRLLSPYARVRSNVADTLCIDRKYEKQLLERSVALQAENFFTESEEIEQPEMPSVYSFKPRYVYDLDEYKRFPSLKETLMEFIPSVIVSDLNGMERVCVFNEKEKAFSKGNSLVLLDGITVMNHEDILNYNPYLLKWIKVYEGNYVFGDQIYNGILVLQTFTGNLNSFTLPVNSMQVEFQGINWTGKTSTGDREVKEKNIPDFRHTLYWNPKVSDRDKELICFTSDMCGVYSVTVEGIGKDGKILYGTCIFEVKE